MIGDEEFLEYVRELAETDEVSQLNGYVSVGTISKAIQGLYRFYNPEIAEMQIRRLAAQGRIVARYLGDMVLGVNIRNV